MQQVLLTGISGYIGLHCARELLAAGFAVRGTVRNAAKQQEVLESFTTASLDTANLTFHIADLTSDDGWQDAATGCDYVMHTASPFAIANPKSEEEMLAPAVDGTLRVMRAAQATGVRRIVLTSSIVAMMGSMKTGTFTPDDWTDVTAKDVSTYVQSKTLAEKAAWDFIGGQGADASIEMVTIHPGGVFGPPLAGNISGQSLAVINQMLRGKQPVVPNVAIPMVDVRDVALLHVQALTKSEAAGHRIIAADDTPRSFADVAQVLKDAGYKGPSTRIAPDFLIRLMALFDREAKGMLGLLGMHPVADNSTTREMFGWTPMAFEESLRDTATAVKRASA